ncbi:TraB/GumN family protein [Phenylobacterium sp.]|uniref:TraB/GumN family protein n=1 Tax=Phenylobacterium sp. TaxID=1871053 RepID=UPI002CB282C3|nr:TraB/GumN family protein [Phenylobacterium sp.]HLZ75751.1 TraB/GumN family protein [Phenylobacterium sp.]
MNRVWKTLAGAFAALAFAGAAVAEPPVWVVKDKDSEIVLFGSIHVLPPGLNWTPPVLERALKAADDIWFELPIDAQSEADTATLATQAGVLPPDGSLFRLLSPQDSALMSKVAAAYDVSPVLVDRLQPWLAEIALAGGAYRRVGADANDGVEKTISAMATPKARREAFETPAEQIGLLSSGTMAEQIASLHETLQEMDEKPDEYQTLLKAWMNADIATLDAEAIKPLRDASPALFRRLVLDRNARWTQVLDARMKGHGHTVVIVGIGHLIGPDGVPARLRALGYSVTGP